MSESPLRCELQAQAQREDKSFVRGLVRVTLHHVVFESADGAPGSFALQVKDISGAPQRNKPGSGRSLLRLNTASGPRLIEFHSEGERDTCTEAVLRAQRGESAPTSHAPDSRWKRLQEDPELHALHRELVGGGVVGEEEFWSLHERHSDTTVRRQVVGFSSLLDAGLEKEVDQRTRREKYILKPEIAQQILAERPSVRRAYIENVPEKMSEAQFWNKYFSWRQRQVEKQRVEELNATTFQTIMQDQEKDKEEDTLELQEDFDLRQKVALSRLRLVDPQVNLASNEGDELHHGWGLRESERIITATTDSGSLPTASTFAGDVNWHGSVVLHGLPDTIITGTATEINKAVAHALDKDTEHEAKELSNYAKIDAMQQGLQKDLIEKECIDDLREKTPEKIAQLCLKNPKAYFRTESGNIPSTVVSLEDAKLDFLNVIDRPTALQRIESPISPLLAREIMFDYSQTQSPREKDDQKLAVDVEIPPQLRFSATKISELLCFFWKMFPPKDTDQNSKLERVKNSMDKEYNDLRSHLDKAPSTERHRMALIVNVLFQSLDVALTAYDEFSSS